MNPAYSVILFTTASGAGYGFDAARAGGFNHGPFLPPIGLTSLVTALGLITVGLLSRLSTPEWSAAFFNGSSWLRAKAWPRF
jgi:hypothetical protein